MPLFSVFIFIFFLFKILENLLNW